MLVVGVTGGIGAGKSTFVQLLAERGAEVIDADQLGRDALRPHEPAWRWVVDTFGNEILLPNSMDVDRKRLAEIVFSDKNKLAAYNAVVHPVIFEGIANALEVVRGTDEVVLLDAALILETGLDKTLDVLIAVMSDKPERLERLRRDRGMSNAEIEERMAAQIDPAELEARADIVVRNSGSLDELEKEADRVWKELSALPQSD